MAKSAPTDSDRWVVFEPSQAPLYEIGAWLTATLAYPEQSKETSRVAAANALAGSALREAFARDPAAARQMQQIRPIHLLTPPPPGGRYGSSQLEARLKHRLEAAMMAGPTISRALRGGPHSPETARVNALLTSKAEFAEQSPEFESANFVQRHFKPTIPVMHLAVAVALLIEQQLNEGKRIGWQALLAKQDLVHWWLTTARDLEPIVLKCWPTLGVEEQYRFRLAH